MKNIAKPHFSFDESSSSGVPSFLFSYFVISGSSDEQKALQIICHLEGAGVERYYGAFARERLMTEEAKDYAVVQAKLLRKFGYTVKPEEELQKAISASLDPREVSGPLAQLDSLHRKVVLNDTESFQNFRKSVTEHRKMVQFVMHRASSD